jgi:2-methylcitrate dehydratase PrpD
VIDGVIGKAGRTMRNGTHAGGITGEIAADGAALTFAKLPADVVELAVQSIMDTLGVALAGAIAPEVELILSLVRAEGAVAKASVIGHDTRLGLRQVALVNGIAAHALDLDDCNLTMQGHASAVVLPVVLALGERHRASGRDLLTAFVVGVEAGCRVGAAMAPGHYDRGFHATGTHGTIAAAAAAARLLDLDPLRTARALSLAASMAAGLKAQFGTMAKPLHAGRAAENWLFAAQLAAARVEARGDVIETEQGYAATHAPHFRPEAAAGGPPETFRIRDNLFKFHAACYGTQGVIEAAAALRARRREVPEAIAAIEIEAAAENAHTCAITHPQNPAEARFSMAHAAALALLGIDTADPSSFAATVAGRDDLARLRGLTSLRFVEGWHIAESRVTLRDHDGRVDAAAAHAGRPGTDLARQRRKLEAKFESLVEALIGAARTRQVLAMIGELPNDGDAASLAAACGSAVKR